MTCPVAPPTPICAMSARIRSFAPTPRQRPVDATCIVVGLSLKQALRREDVLDLARADAEGERAERAVRRRVAVAADDGQPGCVSPSSGPMT